MRIATKHKKFDDAEAEAPEPVLPEDSAANRKKLENLVDMEESDDDEAPEEEEVSAGQKAEELREKEVEKAYETEKRKEKERRRHVQSVFEEQQRQKKEKQLKEEEERKKKEEEAAAVPDELPEELLESYRPTRPTAKPKKTNLQKESVSTESERMKEKLAELRKLSRTSMEKGPVTVKVLGKRRMYVPVSETVGQKEQWLNRKSVRRK